MAISFAGELEVPDAAFDLLVGVYELVEVPLAEFGKQIADGGALVGLDEPERVAEGNAEAIQRGGHGRPVAVGPPVVGQDCFQGFHTVGEVLALDLDLARRPLRSGDEYHRRLDGFHRDEDRLQHIDGRVGRTN